MLSIASMSAGSAGYYLTLARQDYYLNGGEPPGQWWGKGAHKIYLHRVVNAQDLNLLFRGFAPNKEELVQNAGVKGKDHLPGWDLTFSAPKSVSTLWSQASTGVRQEIEAAQKEAVKAALTYLEKEIPLARWGKNGSQEGAAKLIVALFEHGTSRALDPNLHTHALVMNACFREDGSSGAINSKLIYVSKMLLGALYRTELAAQLENRLGVRCDLEAGEFAFSVRGVLTELSKFFSKRRDAIEERLNSKGLESASAAAIAALDTREKKGEIPPRDKLFPTWRSAGQKLGFDPGSVIGHERRKADDPKEFQSALSKALEIITNDRNHFTKSELLTEIAIQAQSKCLSATFVQNQFDIALRELKEIRALGDWKGKFTYTTQEVLNEESKLIKSADRLENKVHGAGENAVERAIWKSTRPLNEEQRDAVRYLSGKGSALRSLEGLAGTGKTSTLAAARQAWEKAGYKVIGAATSGKAARELHDGAGIKTVTIAKLEFMMNPSLQFQFSHHAKQILRAFLGQKTYKLEPIKFDKKTVLVLDEAAMVSTKELAKLAAAVERGGGMLVSVFDRKQLQAIERGGGAAYLADRHGKAELKTIVRQRDLKDVEIVKAFAEGKAEIALKKMNERGLLHVAEDRNTAVKKLVSDWTQVAKGQRETSLIFVGTRAESADINRRCQASRLREQELVGENYVKGDLSLFNNDRVLFTKNSSKLGVQNGSLGTIIELKPKKAIASVKLDTGELIEVPLKTYPSLQLGYAVTTHKGQGTTVNNSFLLVGGGMQNRELTYVQASRAKQAMKIYTDRHECGENFANLAKQMNKSEEKILAHDIIGKKLKEEEDFRMRQRLRF